jgi:hypothetical protein
MAAIPRSVLHVRLSSEDPRLDVARLLEVIHFYLEHTVSDLYFKCGQVPGAGG